MIILFLVGLLLVVALQKENYTFMTLCDRFPNLQQCKQRKLLFPRLRNPPRLPSSLPEPRLPERKPFKHALAFQGGGYISITQFYGFTLALMKIKRQNSPNSSLSSIFRDFSYMSGSSGGQVFMTLMGYDRKFNEDIESIRSLTPEGVGMHYRRTYMKDVLRFIDENQTNPLANELTVFQLPYFIQLTLKIISQTGSLDGVLGLGNTTRVSQSYHQGRLSNKKVVDVLPEYRNTNFICPVTIATVGTLTVPSVPVNYSYNLPTGDASIENLPYNHGPLTRSYILDGLQINEYNTNTINQERFWDGLNSTPRDLPYNKMFDTFEWVRKYDDGIFINTPEPYKVYRCKNVASADCCQNTSVKGIIAPDFSQINYTSKNSLPLTIPGIYADKIQYYSYDKDIEKQPTGEWQDEVTDLITVDAKKSVIEVPTVIEYGNPSQESIASVLAASTSATATSADNCLLKSTLYRSGTSDQEEFFQRVGQFGFSTCCILKAGGPQTNERIYPNVCSALNESEAEITRCNELSTGSRSPDYDENVLLTKMATNKLLVAGDSAFVENNGITSIILDHQAANTLLPLNITVFVIYLPSIEELFKPTWSGPLTPWATDYQDGLIELMDTVNDVANWNILEETAFISGAISAGAILSGLAAVLSPILGVAVTVTLIASLSEIIWEALDLDTDYHTTIDKYGNKITPTFALLTNTIFDTPFSSGREIYTRQYNEDLKFSVIAFDNLVTLENKMCGIKAGTKVSLTIISLSSRDHYPLAPIIRSENDSATYGELAQISFDCLEECYRTSAAVRRRIDASFNI